MKDDLINRQTVIKDLEKLIKDCNPEHFVGHQKFIELMDDAEIGSFGNWQFANGFNIGLTAAELAIEKLPSVQSKQQWIPVSERLPEYMVSVLTWDGHTFCVEKRIPCIRDEDGEIIEGDWWVSDDYDEGDSEYYPNLRDGACVAWMPLPEPYEE